MKAKAAVFKGANIPFEIREFEVTKTPSGYGRSELIVFGLRKKVSRNESRVARLVCDN